MISLETCADLLDDSPNCLALLAAWQRWRGDDAVPTIAAVRAEDIGSALNSVSVLEVIAPDKVIVRLAGELHNYTQEHELKGENFIGLAPPGFKETRVERINNLASYPCGAIWEARVDGESDDRPRLSGLMLPVRPNEDADPMRIYLSHEITGFVGIVPNLRKLLMSRPRDLTYVDIGHGAPE